MHAALLSATLLLSVSAVSCMQLYELDPPQRPKEPQYYKHIGKNGTTLLGKGSYGNVWLMERLSDKARYAMKEFTRKGKDDKFKSMEDELLGLRATENSSYAAHLTCFIPPNKLILDYQPGGTLYDALIHVTDLTPTKRRRIFSDLIYAIRDMHKAGIWYVIVS
jgi:serine/threonine protein kinase